MRHRLKSGSARLRVENPLTGMFLACVLYLLFGFSIPALSQQNSDGVGAGKPGVSDTKFEQLLERGSKSDSGSTAAADEGFVPETLSADLLGEEGAKTMRLSLRSYYQYRIEGFEHRTRIFQWQHFSTRIIFWMVILIVLAGLYFSWMQFHATKDSTQLPETTLEASAKGFKVSSPVLGVIILAISLAFFYLYLVHIYPIVNTF